MTWRDGSSLPPLSSLNDRAAKIGNSQIGSLTSRKYNCATYFLSPPTQTMRFREYNSSTVHTGSLQWRDENGDELSSFTLEKSAAKGDVTPSSSSSSSSSHQHHRHGAYQEYHLVSSRRNGSSKEKLCWAIREYIPPVGLEKGGGNGVRVGGTNTTTRRLMGALQSKVMDICRKVDQICKDLFLPVG